MASATFQPNSTASPHLPILIFHPEEGRWLRG